MRLIAFDTETWLLTPGVRAPRMVCLSYASDPEKPQIVLREQALLLARGWLHEPDTTLVGHNVWFDLGVVVTHRPDLLPTVFQAVDAGRIQDTQLRQEMIDLANGELKFYIDEETGEVNKSRYGLADLSKRLLGEYVAKKDTWRLRYGELDGVPLAEWPEDARRYALKDASQTLRLYQNQEQQLERASWAARQIDGWRISKVTPNQLEQHRAAWALHLMSMQGVRTDPIAVQELKRRLTNQYAEQMTKLRPTGLFNITPARAFKSGPRKGQVRPEQVTKNMKAIYARVAKAYTGRMAPYTPSGRMATDKKTLKDSGDPELQLLAEAGGTQKLLTTYLPILESGTQHPICCRYNPLMETGRTSASGPNMQNPPRAGGVRECFVPSDGYLYGFVDYDTLELRALAQACLDLLGHSKMAEALRRGEDLHLSLAAEMLGIPLTEAQVRSKQGDPVVKEYRQQAKPANFGFPGGMQADSFREYAEGYGIKLTPAQALKLHETWFRKWPEMSDYFDHVKALPDPLRQLRSNRVRGGASFTAAANGFFQGLAADGAKEALWRVARECYLDPASPLYGSRPVLFLHDEIGIEAPDDHRAAPACERLAVVMREAMEAWIPDVPIRCGAVMMRRWYKGAEAVRVDGVLVPSRPVKTEDGKTKWVADQYALAA